MSALQGPASHAPVDDLTVQAERIAAGYGPVYVVVDEADDVVLFSRGTAPFLDPAGATTLHLPSLVAPEIAGEVRQLLQWSRATGLARRAAGLIVHARDGVRHLAVAVEPLPPSGAAGRRLMVLFQDGGVEPGAPPLNERGQVGRLTSDLHRVKGELQAATEELAFSNEEYQTSTEELETSNEELGATSEALRSANEELQARVAQLDQANSDVRHMLQGTQIAIVFLDGALRIRSFTPAMREVFRLIDQDRGRPLTDIAAHVAYPELAADIQHVLRTHDTTEREVDSLQGMRRYLVRVLPYRLVNETMAGVVLAFIDVSVAHQANQARRESDDRLHRMAASVPAFLFIACQEGGLDYVNPPFYAFTGMTEGQALGFGWLAAIHPDDLAAAGRVWQAGADAGVVVEHEIRLRRADGASHWFLLRVTPQFDEAGRVLRWFGSCTDIDLRRQAEARQSLMLAELQHRVKNILAFVRSLLIRTVKSSADLDNFADHFAGRIDALARSQTAAARTPEQQVMLDELVIEELAAHGGQNANQTNVTGPNVALPEKMAGTIGLALHELTTNAVKYGGLSVPSGKIDVCWRVEPCEPGTDGAKECLTIDWHETGVPITDLNPTRRGFGRELIEQGLPYDLGATTILRFNPGGVSCQIRLPMAANDRRGRSLGSVV